MSSSYTSTSFLSFALHFLLTSSKSYSTPTALQYRPPMSKDDGSRNSRSSRSKSKSKRRKSSRTSSVEKEEHLIVLPELGEKLRRMSSSQESSSSSRRRPSSRRRYRRSSRSRGSNSTNESLRNELENKVERMQSSEPNGTSARSSALESGSLPDLVTIDTELSIEDYTPGAYRIDSVGQISSSLASASDGQSEGSGYDEDSDIRTAGTSRLSSSARSSTVTSTLRSVSEEQASTMVEAEVAPDIEDELEEARQRGRQEALSEVERQTIRGNIAVVETAEDDDNKEALETEARNRRRVVCRYAVLFALILIALVATSTILLFGKQQEAPAQLDGWNGDSNAKVVIVYTPPTREECEAIADGTLLLEDQQSLIEKSFDVQIDITLASEEDIGPLFSAMLRHIQEKLIPIMAGCGAIGFLETTFALTDGLKNATNSIATGQVEKKSEQPCDDNGDSNGNCRRYVLVLDLYLKEEQSSVSLIEVIGNALNGDELANAIGSLYPVQTATVHPIVPSDNFNDVTTYPTVLDLVTVVPTQSPDTYSAPIPSFAAPTLAPTVARPLTPGSTQRPTSKIETTIPTTKLPTAQTDSGQDSPSTAPDRPPTQSPSRMATPGPNTESPIKIPSSSPTRSPTTPPRTRVPTLAPTTRNPTKGPTMAPNVLPTVAATPPPSHSHSKLPTDEPSTSPSMISTPIPTVSPTLAPVPAATEAPSVTPSFSSSRAPTLPPTPTPTSPPSPLPTTKEPSTPPTTAQPSTSGGSAEWCCSTDYKSCGNLDLVCNVSEFACEVTCNAHWMQLNSCSSGLARWSACINNVKGCCPPAVCTSQGPTYSACI